MPLVFGGYNSARRDENPASTRNKGFSLCLSCVTDFSLSAGLESQSK
jgi:hypothetical protein